MQISCTPEKSDLYCTDRLKPLTTGLIHSYQEEDKNEKINHTIRKLNDKYFVLP